MSRGRWTRASYRFESNRNSLEALYWCAEWLKRREKAEPVEEEFDECDTLFVIIERQFIVWRLCGDCVDGNCRPSSLRALRP